MTAHYEFAHHALRLAFLRNPERTMRELCATGARSFVNKIAMRLKDRANLNPDAVCIHRVVLEERQCVIVEMPPARNPVEACFIALYQGSTRLHHHHCFYPAARLAHYFTIERPVDGPTIACPSLFCAWDEDTHFNFGTGPKATIVDFVPRIRAALFEGGAGPWFN